MDLQFHFLLPILICLHLLMMAVSTSLPPIQYTGEPWTGQITASKTASTPRS